MFSNFFEIIILSAIQGITEFLPISSSAHLILVNKISNLQIGSLYLDTGMHLGSLLAIIFFFRNDLIKILEDKKLLYLIILGSFPTIILGAILYTSGFIYYFRSLDLIAWTTLIFAILLYISDKFKVNKKIQNDLNLKSILTIGFFQMLALVPGVSRSGIVITAARFLNFDRYDFKANFPGIGYPKDIQQCWLDDVITNPSSDFLPRHYDTDMPEHLNGLIYEIWNNKKFTTKFSW